MSPSLSPVLLLSSPTVSQVETATPTSKAGWRSPLVNLVTGASQARSWQAEWWGELLYQRTIQLNVW